MDFLCRVGAVLILLSGCTSDPTSTTGDRLLSALGTAALIGAVFVGGVTSAQEANRPVAPRYTCYGNGSYMQCY